MIKKYKAIVKSKVILENNTESDDHHYYINAQLSDNEIELGIRKLFFHGKPIAIYDERLNEGLVCEVAVDKQFIEGIFFNMTS
jgi:uncharacterized membrane-anchored protein